MPRNLRICKRNVHTCKDTCIHARRPTQMQKRPTHMQRDIHTCKDTNTNTKRHTKGSLKIDTYPLPDFSQGMRRDPHTCKETYTHAKRPTHMQRDIHTCKETYTYQRDLHISKRPTHIKETYTYAKRLTHLKEVLQKRQTYFSVGVQRDLRVCKVYERSPTKET